MTTDAQTSDYRSFLEAQPVPTLRDWALEVAKDKHDVGFYWEVAKHLPSTAGGQPRLGHLRPDRRHPRDRPPGHPLPRGGRRPRGRRPAPGPLRRLPGRARRRPEVRPTDWLWSPDDWLSRLLLQRGLAAVYLVAFLVTANQFRPLLGERGLQPAPRFLAAVPFRRAPSLFHLHYSDRFLTLVAWAGAGLAAAALAGLPDAGPAWLSLAVWLALWALYLSIVNVGQTFYGFGWETLLLEAGFLAIFLGPAATAPPTLVLWLYRWLLFRVEFGAGLIKLRGDRCWRDLSCLDYHHETQPLPGPAQLVLPPPAPAACTGPRCWPTTPPSWWCRSACSPPSPWPPSPPWSSSSPRPGCWSAATSPGST